jgi:hypothetical protein
MGQMRWATKDANKFHSVEQKFKDGLALTMTKVSIVKEAKKDYVHCPIQLVVNVGSTSFSPLLNSSVIGNSYPEPPASIADCSHLTKQQLFDVTALVRSVSKCRPVKDNRVVFDVVILDGSKSDERVRTMPLTVFTERPIGLNSGEPSMWLFLNEASKIVLDSLLVSSALEVLKMMKEGTLLSRPRTAPSWKRPKPSKESGLHQSPHGCWD